MTGISEHDRITPLAGGHNFRDLGGYATRDGRSVARGRVFRSGTMAELTDEDHAILDRLGIRLICDFRTARERRHQPSRLPAEPGFELWERDYDASGADLVSALIAPGMTPAGARNQMIALYRSIAYEQADSYRELFSRIAAGHLPVVFHCAAGKDRTGAAAALLLDLLGVSRETIVEDYVLTDHCFERGLRLVGRDHLSSRLATIDEAIWHPMMRADTAYIEMLFETIAEKHGSAEAYVRDVLGLGDNVVAAIRRELIV